MKVPVVHGESGEGKRFRNAVDSPDERGRAESTRTPQPPFRLTRYFSLASLLGLLVVVAVLLFFYRYLAFAALTDHESHNNIALARVFANTIWPNHAVYVKDASAIPKFELAQRPEVVALKEDVLRQMAGLSVVKVKVYNLDGLTVFSTDPKQIGEDKSTNGGFLTAKAGGVASEITFRDSFDAFEKVINDRNLVSSYIPIRQSQTSPVEGVMEVYSDVTDYVTKLARTQWQIVGGVLGSLSLLYLFLLTIVRRADRLIQTQSAAARLAHEAILRHQENYDSLTGVANRGLFLDRLNQSIHAAARSRGKFALVLADLERLRTVNESLGRQAGDALLAQVAERLVRVAGRAEVARISADQFAVVLPAVKGKSETGRIVQALLHGCFGESFAVLDTQLRVSAKTGVALYPGDGTDAETLLKHAEAALRESKARGERFAFYTPDLTERTAATLTLETKLRQALENDEFVLHYQPKVELDSRRIVGVEALIRWQSPEMGLVPPMKFIPLMEETGMILDVGAWALRRAAIDHRRWLEQQLAPPRVAVNVSAIQLRQRDFVAAVEKAIAEGVTPTGIDLEITESLVMHDIEDNIRKLKEVRALGVSISIDDFGTGYSSLGYLAKLPVQTLKIDRSFIITMLNNPDTMTLVSTMIALAHSLRMTVVAEGVDEEEQAKMLRLLRCDQMQGYLFSKPVAFEEMTVLLKQGARV